MLDKVDSAMSPVQADLIAYWQDLRREAGGNCPARAAVNPWLLGLALADVSLLEQTAPAAGKGGVRFRLAGSSITSLVGRSLKGVAVDTIEEPYASLWRLGVGEALETGKPVHGRVEGAIEGKDLTWLRLPLLDQHGARRIVLCHDGWSKPMSRAKPARRLFIPTQKPPIAA